MRLHVYWKIIQQDQNGIIMQDKMNGFVFIFISDFTTETKSVCSFILLFLQFHCDFARVDLTVARGRDEAPKLTSGPVGGRYLRSMCRIDRLPCTYVRARAHVWALQTTRGHCVFNNASRENRAHCH